MRALLCASPLAVVGFLGCAQPLAKGELHGFVVASTPVANADIRISQLSDDGSPPREIAHTRTSSEGEFSVAIGTGRDLLLIEVKNDGTYNESASGEVVVGDGRTTPNEAPTVLSAAIANVRAGSTNNRFTVSPLTTLAFHLALARREANASLPLSGRVREANALIGSHFGDIDILATAPTAVHQARKVELDPPVRYGLVLAGMSILAADIARLSELSAKDSNTLRLVAGVVDHLDSEFPVLGGRVSREYFGSCGQCKGDVACRMTCGHDSHTLRARLAQRIKTFIESKENQTGLTSANVMPMLEALADNDNADLFPDDNALLRGTFSEIFDERSFHALFNPTDQAACLVRDARVEPVRLVPRFDDEVDKPIIEVFKHDINFTGSALPGCSDLTLPGQFDVADEGNPLVFNFAAHPAIVAVQFRVARPGSLPGPWRDAQQVDDIDQFMFQLPVTSKTALGVENADGVWSIELQVHDVLGRLKALPAKVRWNHHLLSLPPEIGPLEIPDTTKTPAHFKLVDPRALPGAPQKNLRVLFEPDKDGKIVIGQIRLRNRSNRSLRFLVRYDVNVAAFSSFDGPFAGTEPHGPPVKGAVLVKEVQNFVTQGMVFSHGGSFKLDSGSEQNATRFGLAPFQSAVLFVMTDHWSFLWEDAVNAAPFVPGTLLSDTIKEHFQVAVEKMRISNLPNPMLEKPLPLSVIEIETEVRDSPHTLRTDNVNASLDLTVTK